MVEYKTLASQLKFKEGSDLATRDIDLLIDKYSKVDSRAVTKDDALRLKWVVKYLSFSYDQQPYCNKVIPCLDLMLAKTETCQHASSILLRTKFQVRLLTLHLDEANQCLNKLRKIA
jgi:hypothetical protein